MPIMWLMWCDIVTSCHMTVTMWHLWRNTFPHFLLCSKSKIKRKEKKRNIDNDLAVFAKSWHNSSRLYLKLWTLSAKMIFGIYLSFQHWRCVRLANSKAGIKPTAPLSAFDKENSIEFPLDFLHYLYNYYMVCALFSHAYHVTHYVTSMWCDAVTSCHVTMTMWHLWCDTFPHFPLCSKSKIKEKKRKEI